MSWADKRANPSPASPLKRLRPLVFIGAAFLALLTILIRAYERYWFPRDPDRTVDSTFEVVAPADGRLVYVARVRDGSVPLAIKGRTAIPLPEIVEGPSGSASGVLLGIFMSPFDVHYQRSPIPGRVAEITYHPSAQNHLMGSMFVRSLLGIRPAYTRSLHIVENERNVVHIVNDQRHAYVVQIADRQVNRIDCYVRPGDRVHMGEKIGMIRRGSQVDLFLPGLDPADLHDLAVGDRLRAGETPIVR